MGKEKNFSLFLRFFSIVSILIIGSTEIIGIDCIRIRAGVRGISMRNSVLHHPQKRLSTVICEEPIEVERKYVIHQPSLVESLVNGIKVQVNSQDRDIYYDTVQGHWYRKGVFIRNRNSSKLEFKFNKNDFESNLASINHTHCAEHPFKIPIENGDISRLNELLGFLGLKTVNNASLDEFIETNGLIESIILNKSRRKYLLPEEYEICIDDVKELGHFMEIEYQARSNENITHILKGMDEIIGSLRLSPLTAGYAELYMRKHNYELYKAGKYLLMEDRVA